MKIAESIIISALQKLPKNEPEFNALKRDFVKADPDLVKLPSKAELLKAYHSLLTKKSIKANKDLEKLLTKRSVRTLSGVTIITSLVKPYACPGKCVYCPLDVRMPKSYLADEPAAARAMGLKFDPFLQMTRRIEALEANGHPTEKIELIIKGGTWNAYPLQYQYWFILRSFEAANLGKSSLVSGASKLKENSPLEILKAELNQQQRKNERSKHRIIGLTLETRPDCINKHTLWQMREQGCTRLEIGVQNTDDRILELIKRGHTSEQVRLATQLAKDFGFKTDFHLMPQLPGSSPEKDLSMLRDVFEDQGFRPDMIKIYPCTVIKGSELFTWLQEGKYQPYSTGKLISILTTFKPEIPKYVRVSRLIRDIPGQHIEGGNKITNLRQVIQNELKKEGLKCHCLRCREIGHVDQSTIKNLKPTLFVEKYNTNGGTEYFLSFEDNERTAVFAFCRLRIVDEPINGKVLKLYKAYIRELHTYGQLVRIGKQNKESAQHKGLGKRLMKEAEKIAKRSGALKMAVISGVGVRGYYRNLGYKLEKTYMVKTLK